MNHSPIPTIVAGHTYDTGASPPRETGAGDGGTGIDATSIVAVLVLALATLAILAWLNPSAARARLRSAAPLALMAVLAAAPLIVWAASSGGAGPSLIVERAIARSGAPELIVYLSDAQLNTLRTSRGRRAVRVECVGREGQPVLAARHRWPFAGERGYDYPHVHQRVTREQLERVSRCRVQGTRVPLEAEVTACEPATGAAPCGGSSGRERP